MDERYLRFPRWIELSGLPRQLARELGVEAWVVFRRLVEEDLAQNLFPDWVDFRASRIASVCGISEESTQALLTRLSERGLLRVRNLGDSTPYYQYRVAQPLPVPRSREELVEALRAEGLPDRAELWRYWENPEGESKYERIVRLYESTCGLKISGRIVEELVELAETCPLSHLEEAFAAAREEGVTTLGWIRKYLKRLKKHERVQEAWGRPGGLELPEGYTVPSEKD